MAEGQYKFSIGLDDKQLDLDIQQAKKAFDDLVKAARDAGAKIDKSFKNPFEGLTPPTDLPQKTQAVAQSFNGLNMATQQLVRELPAATMGINTFFLAVSNNLPVLADQIKQVSAENKRLAASGQPTVGVFKQIIGSLFSWQTALVVGVTALTMYGKEIGNWIAGLFKGKKALDAVAEAERTLHDVRTQGVVDAQEEVVKINLAVKAMQDSTKSLDERKRAMMMLQEEYPEYLGNLTEEQMLNGDVADSVADLVKNIIALKEARQALNKIVENEENMRLLERTRGYAQWVAANEAFEGVGRKYEFKQQVGGRASDYVWKNTREGYMYDKAQEQLLDNLEAMGKEGEKLVEIINDKYNGNVDAYIKAVTASNEKLKESATALVTDDKDSDNGAAQREAEARARRIATLTKQLATDAEREATQAKIDAMAEGINKELAQIDHDYDLREQRIREREEQLKEARGGYLTESDMAGFNALREANRAERDRARASAHSFLDSTEEDIFGDTDKAMAEATEQLREELSKRNKAWEDYIIAYGTFQERLLGTAHKYNRLIAEAETEGERMALEAERDAILAEYEVQASDFAKSLVDMTTAQLNTMLEELQAQVDAKQAAFDALDSSSSDDAKKYRDEINQLKAKIKELQAQLGKAKKEASDGNWAEAAQVIQGIGNAATEAAEGTEVFDEGFATALRSVANVTSATTNLLSGIQMLITGSTAATAAIRAMETASVILAVIAAAIQLVSALVSAFSDNEMEESIAKFNELNAEIVQMNRLAKIDNWGDTIFGKDAFGNFINNIRLMQEASKAFEESKQNIQDYRYNKQKEYYEYLLQYYAHTPQEEAFYLDLINKLEQKDRTFIGALGDMQVTLSKRKLSTLAEQLPGMFEDGEVTLKELEDLQKSDVWDKLSQENRDLISQMIADWQVYEDTTKAVNDYLKDIFGDYGETVTDILVDSFKEGTDAVEAFGDAASGVIEQLTKDFMYSTFIQDFVDKAGAEIEKLNANEELTPEERVKGYIDILKELESNILGVQGDMNAALEALDAAGYGFDGEGSRQSATSKGFQAMSQDTGDELNGRATAIQSHTFALVEGQKRLISDSAQILRHLAGIESNTEKLHHIDDSMDAIRRDISDIATRGVIMRE